ncbi:MAG: SUF system NifU family Fe-S cluster assembly protein [bacterium]|nr:SUF system NifU family Fe-S cluster assembly protein [bacterium]
MGDLRDLYQEVILDHGRRPRNVGNIAPPCSHADGYNPLCGDKLTLYLRIEDDTVSDVKFEGAGCAIFTASCSLLTEALIGKSIEEANELCRRFVAMSTTPVEEECDTEGLGKLGVFAGVREFPARVKCATLAWHTFENAVRGSGESAQTE